MEVDYAWNEAPIELPAQEEALGEELLFTDLAYMSEIQTHVFEV